MSEGLNTTLRNAVMELDALRHSPKEFVEELQKINGWANSITRLSSATAHNEIVNNIQIVLRFLDELSEALDNGADDIGGSRSETHIMNDLVSAARRL